MAIGQKRSQIYKSQFSKNFREAIAPQCQNIVSFLLAMEAYTNTAIYSNLTSPTTKHMPKSLK